MGFHSVLIRTSLLLLAGIALLPQTDAALAAMSIDFGSQFIKIGIVKPGVPMEIVLNKESRRKTPNVLAIRNGERLFAEAAAALASKYPKSAYQYLLSLLAKQKGDSSVEDYKKSFPFHAISFDKNRNTVTFPSDSETYNVETLLAMILWNAKQTAAAYAGQTVKDVVITVPSFYTQAERRALSAAADIAGLNLLQLLSDGSAAALNYGVFRRKEITEKPTTMLIYDMGAMKTTATLVEYVLEGEKGSKDKNPVVRAIGVGFDRTLGGLEITQRLTKHLEEIFRKTVKTPTDIATNARSMSKLFKEAERVKQVLSANKDTFAQIENVHEEQNFRVKVTREELEAMITDMLPKIEQPITDALAMAELSIDKVDQVVMMGAGTRMPKVQEILTKAIAGKELGRFLNTDEAIALGAVYQAAHLSKSFKVLPFGVQEIILYPIQVNFQTKTEAGDIKDTSRAIFGYKTHYPTSKKTVNFQSYSDDFEISLSYGSFSHLKKEQISAVGETNLQAISVKGVADGIKKELSDEFCELKGIKTTFSIDLSGIVDISKSEVHVERKPSPEELSKYEEDKKAFEDYETEVKKEKEEKKKAEEERKKKEKEAKDKNATETEEVKQTEEKEPEESKVDIDEKKEKKLKVLKPTEPKAKTLKTTLDVTSALKDLKQVTPEEIKAAKKILSDYETAEKEKHEREEAMNGLEALVYDLPIKLEEGEEFSQFVTAEEKEKILTEVQRLRTWLEDDVSLETKTQEFLDNKKILDDLVKAPNYRKKQRLEMPKYVDAIDQSFNRSHTFFASAKNLTETMTEDPVFTATELEVLEKLITETETWWKEKQEAFTKQAMNEDLAVTTIDIAEKTRDLDREVRYLVNKLKNFKPKKKPEPKKSEAEKEKVTEEETLEEPITEESIDATTEEAKKEEHDASEL